MYVEVPIISKSKGAPSLSCRNSTPRYSSASVTIFSTGSLITRIIFSLSVVRTYVPNGSRCSHFDVTALPFERDGSIWVWRYFGVNSDVIQSDQNKAGILDRLRLECASIIPV